MPSEEIAPSDALPPRVPVRVKAKAALEASQAQGRGPLRRLCNYAASNALIGVPPSPKVKGHQLANLRVDRYGRDVGFGREFGIF